MYKELNIKFYRILNKVDNIEINNFDIDKCPEDVIEALCDDLNTSKAIAEIIDISKKLSKANNHDDKAKLKAKLLAAGKVFGILNENPKKWLGIGQAGEEIDPDYIEKLINERNQSRIDKNFQKADEIRNELSKLNIEIEDTKDGTIWRLK